MKNILLSALILFGITISAQTVQIETEMINKAIMANRWSQEELPEIARRWTQLKGNYPMLQYDSLSGQVIVEDFIEFYGIQKSQAFKRIKEWAAINFSSLDRATHYEDLESGKLILKGYTEITSFTKVRFLWNTENVPSTSDLYFTMAITVKDGKAKVRFEYLRFRNFRAGYSVGSYYIPGEWEETSLKSFLPIVYRKSTTWEQAFELLNKCDAALRRLMPSMQKYVRDTELDYKF